MISGGNANRRNAIFVFDLTDVTQDFATADLGLFLTSITGSVAFSVDLYGVGFNSTSAIPASATFKNPAPPDGSNTLIQSSFATTSSTTGSFLNTSITGDANLLSFLNTRPDGAAGNFVFFRLNQNAPGGGNNRFFTFASADTAGIANDPTLTFTAVPEPGAAWLILAAGFAGLTIRRVRRNRR